MSIVWWLIIIGSFLMLSFITVGVVIIVKLSRRNRLRVNIVLKTRRLHRFLVKPLRSGDKIEFNKCTYVFDDEAMIRGKFIDNIYYYEDNPEPIFYDFKANIPRTKAKDLQTMLNTDLIEKLFNEKLFQTMQMLLIIILILTAITLICVAVSFFTGTDVQLRPSPENYGMLINATRVAIGGY